MCQLKRYTTLALQPLQSYGLTPHTVTAVNDKGQHVSLELCPESSTAAAPLSTSAEEKTKTALFLLDRFAVSDEFYHELAQVAGTIVTT